MYCTLKDDTLQHIAAEFRTTWVQIWSANYPGWYGLESSFQGSDATPWMHTQDPDGLKEGLLIRLGPIYKTMHDSSPAALAKRFQVRVPTTRDAVQTGA